MWTGCLANAPLLLAGYCPLKKQGKGDCAVNAKNIKREGERFIFDVELFENVDKKKFLVRLAHNRKAGDCPPERIFVFESDEGARRVFAGFVHQLEYVRDIFFRHKAKHIKSKKTKRKAGEA
jgi:hypothetical protein